MLQSIDFGNLVTFLVISIIAIAVTIGCYGLMCFGIDLWEKITGNALEDKFENCLPWLEDKES